MSVASVSVSVRVRVRLTPSLLAVTVNGSLLSTNSFSPPLS
jgi:hypothetical protein